MHAQLLKELGNCRKSEPIAASPNSILNSIRTQIVTRISPTTAQTENLNLKMILIDDQETKLEARIAPPRINKCSAQKKGATINQILASLSNSSITKAAKASSETSTIVQDKM